MSGDDVPTVHPLVQVLEDVAVVEPSPRVVLDDLEAERVGRAEGLDVDDRPARFGPAVAVQVEGVEEVVDAIDVEADPLADYLDSLPRFKALPADALVLPSHGLPFYGVHARADQLARHHELRLDDLARLMDKPRSAMELARGLFARAVQEGQGRLALAETLAHANYLVGRGRAVRTKTADGRILYGRAEEPDSDLMAAQ